MDRYLIDQAQIIRPFIEEFRTSQVECGIRWPYQSNKHPEFQQFVDDDIRVIVQRAIAVRDLEVRTRSGTEGPCDSTEAASLILIKKYFGVPSCYRPCRPVTSYPPEKR